MPPFTGWYLGATNIGELIDRSARAGIHDMPMIETRANGQPAFGLYMRTPQGDFTPFHLQVLDLDGDQVRARRRVLRPAAVRDVRAAGPAARRLPARRPGPDRERRHRRPRGPGPPMTAGPDPRRPLEGAVELLERSLGYTRVMLADVRPDNLERADAVRGLDPGRLLAHMEDALDAFTEAAAGRVEVAARRRRRRPRRRAPREGVRPARRLDRRPGPPPVAVGDRRLDAAAAGRDRGPGDHRPRLGRRPGDRQRARRSRTTWRAGCSRSPPASCGPPTAAPASAAPAVPASTTPTGRLLAFLGRMTGPVGWNSGEPPSRRGHCFLTLPHGAHRPADGRVRPRPSR